MFKVTFSTAAAACLLLCCVSTVLVTAQQSSGSSSPRSPGVNPNPQRSNKSGREQPANPNRTPVRSERRRSRPPAMAPKLAPSAPLFFKPIELSDASSMQNGTSVVWTEWRLVTPSGDGSARDWALSRIKAVGERSTWGPVDSWVTRCGYLQWDHSKSTVTYTAEVDGCAVREPCCVRGSGGGGGGRHRSMYMTGAHAHA
jgi:hypothetical protein